MSPQILILHGIAEVFLLHGLITAVSEKYLAVMAYYRGSLSTTPQVGRSSRPQRIIIILSNGNVISCHVFVQDNVYRDQWITSDGQLFCQKYDIACFDLDVLDQLVNILPKPSLLHTVTKLAQPA